MLTRLSQNPKRDSLFAYLGILPKFVFMERFLRAIRNKYLIAVVAFVVWMLFFDRHDMATQYSYYSQLKGLKAEKEFYTSEIDRIAKAIHDLNNDPKEQQRVARERYQMKKDNEDIFVIVEQETE